LEQRLEEDREHSSMDCYEVRTSMSKLFWTSFSISHDCILPKLTKHGCVPKTASKLKVKS